MSNKYARLIHSCEPPGGSVVVDVYAVLEAFDVRCPAVQHAVKKLLCAGLRGSKDRTQDLVEAQVSICRAIEINRKREKEVADGQRDQPG